MHDILAIDTNRYITRLAVVAPDGYLHQACEGRPEDVEKLLSFARDHAHGLLCIAASPLDLWPRGLQYNLEHDVARINWVSPAFLRATQPEVTRLLHKRKFDRARLLALAARSTAKQEFEPDEVVRKWQRSIVDDLHQRLLDITP